MSSLDYVQAEASRPDARNEKRAADINAFDASISSPRAAAPGPASTPVASSAGQDAGPTSGVRPSHSSSI